MTGGMCVVPWHHERSCLKNGWCRGDNYSSILPDVRYVAARGKAKVLATKVAQAQDDSDDKRPDSPFAVSPKSTILASACRTPITLPPHGADRKPGPMIMRLQRVRQDGQAHDGVFGTDVGSQHLEEAIAVSNLERCRIGDNPNLSPAVLMASASGMPRLRELCLRGTAATNETIEAFVSNCPDVEILDVSDCTALTNIDCVASWVGLRELNVARCSEAVTAEFVASLQSLRKLELINFNFCEGVTGSALQELSLGCKALTFVNLGGCPKLHDAGLAALAKSNPGITNLSLALNPKCITDDGVAFMLRNLRRLRNLNCTGCPQLYFRTPQALSKFCERIEELSMASLKHLLDDELKQILVGCPMLQRLDLCGCSSLTESGLQNITFGKRLRSVALTAIPELSQQGLSQLRAAMPSVRFDRHFRTHADPNELTLYLGEQVPAPKAKVTTGQKKNAKDKKKK